MARFLTVGGARSGVWLWGIAGAGLALRLIEIDGPLIDQQAWRQADTAAIARNFYSEGFDLLYPRVDWRGTTSGHVETNFPLFPYLVACLYATAGGAHEWLGRLLAAFFAAATVPFLYGLVRRAWQSERCGLLATALLVLSPLNLFFGRAFMPEALMLFLSVAALWGLGRWLETRRWADYVLAVGAAALCFMVKIPTLYLGFPLVALAWQRWGWGFLRQPLLWLYLVLVLLPAAAWYAHAYSLFEETGLTFGIWNNQGYDKWSLAPLASAEFYSVMAGRFWHSVFTPLGCVLVVAGVALGRRQQQGLFAYGWLAGLVLYVLLVPEGNRKLHYYQLPFVPAGAVFAALALDRLWARAGRLWAAAALAALGAYTAWAVIPYYRPPNNIYNYYLACWTAGRTLDAKLPPGALVVVGDVDENAGAPNRAQSPTLLYYCRRKGWQITPDQFSQARLDSLSGAGATHFVAAGNFVMQREGFWKALLRRGVSIPPAYPRRWHEQRAFVKGLEAYRGLDRHFVVVDLARP